jgi:hypothetical protein
MQTYATARTVGQFAAFAGWVTIALGCLILVLALGTIRSSFGLVALAPAFSIAIAGFVLVCQGQLIQALADTAMNTGTLVQLMRSGQAMAQPAGAASMARAGTDVPTQPEGGVRAVTREGKVHYVPASVVGAGEQAIQEYLRTGSIPRSPGAPKA